MGTMAGMKDIAAITTCVKKHMRSHMYGNPTGMAISRAGGIAGPSIFGNQCDCGA